MAENETSPIAGQQQKKSTVENGCKNDDKKLQHSNFITTKDKFSVVTLDDILKTFNAPISEDQAWAIIYQTTRMYKQMVQENRTDLQIPSSTGHLIIQKDGNCNISRTKNNDVSRCLISSQKKILLKLGIIVYTALDYNLPSDEECPISNELEQLINFMAPEENEDEGIERDDEEDAGIVEDKDLETKELDYVMEFCTRRVSPSNPDEHYKAVCRALATETLELKSFLRRVYQGDTEVLRLKANIETSGKELAKICFNDWARFWMQVVDELRRGVRLKKINYTRTPIEYELTPYEILMEDIRTRKYNLRKVMVNGDIPPKVKMDAHAVILEFIRSRPPLRKASERKLPPHPLKQVTCPREQLLDSIRKGRVLKKVRDNVKLKRLLPTNQLLDGVKKSYDEQRSGRSNSTSHATSSHSSATTNRNATNVNTSNTKNTLRLIAVDFSLFEDEDFMLDSTSSKNDFGNHTQPYSLIPTRKSAGQPSSNNENNQNNINTAVLRRTTYDLATQCESRRASMRRHTIIGCNQNYKFDSGNSHSMPPTRPTSRQSDHGSTQAAAPQPATVMATATATNNVIQNQNNPSSSSSAATGNNSNVPKNNSSNNLPFIDSWAKNSLDEQQWKDTFNLNDRLSLTLEEIVHIRSVMTKAELEGLPVDVHIKEDVEKRKVCFLCLRTRFTIFGSRGVLCKLCQRTVCNKCFTKMRIPTDHFRNVPVVLLSPSLMSSPCTSNTPSPSHHAHGGTSSHGGSGQSSLVDESFPRSLMERLMRPELDKKMRNTVGSAPSSPKNQRSTSSTPGSSLTNEQMSLSTTATISAGGVGAKETSLNIHLNHRNSLMSRSMEGPNSLPPQSPARPHSNSSTLDRKNRFSKAFTLSMAAQTAGDPQKDRLTGELMAVCNDCRSLVLEIIRSSRQTRSTARNHALRNLTLDLSPVYKRC